MKLYTFNISDEPRPKKNYRYGELVKVVYNNGEEIYGGRKIVKLSGRPRLEDDLENLQKIIIESHFQKKTNEPFPNFMQVRWAFICADNKARIILDELKVPYKSLPVEIIQTPIHEYKSIFFHEYSDLIALKESNVYLSNDGFIKTIGENQYIPFLSKLKLKSEATKIRGIFGLRESAALICNDEVKSKLEESGLTGFYFEEIQIMS